MQKAKIAGNGAKPPVARRNGSGDTEQARPPRVADPTAISQPVTRGATGPRTERGKAISSKNGLKHGFLSGEVVIRSKNWSESRSQFNKLVRGYMDHYKPVGPVEMHELEIAVCALWRYRRILRFEGGAILEPKPLPSLKGLDGYFLWKEYQDKLRALQEHQEAEERSRDQSNWIDHQPLNFATDGLEKVQRYEAHLLRIYYRALHELERLQRMRLGDVVPAPVVVDIQN